LLVHQERRVGVRLHVLLELQVVGEDVVDHAAEERNIGAGPHRDMLIGQRAGPGEPRVDVDDPGAASLGLHHPLEPDRMGLGHVRAHDDDAVGVGQVLLVVGGAATPE
jgi:hypothetical protein